MKVCSRCKVELSAERKHSYCKPCAAAYDRVRYAALDGAERERKRRNKAKIIEFSIELNNQYKLSRGCVDCGYSKRAVALQFDHVDDNKEFNVSDGLRRGLSLATIIKEMEKCEVRCANCHAEVTEDRRARGRR